jgi:hypothetical protein
MTKNKCEWVSVTSWTRPTFASTRWSFTLNANDPCHSILSGIAHRNENKNCKIQTLDDAWLSCHLGLLWARSLGYTILRSLCLLLLAQCPFCFSEGRTLQDWDHQCITRLVLTSNSLRYIFLHSLVHVASSHFGVTF